MKLILLIISVSYIVSCENHTPSKRNDISDNANIFKFQIPNRNGAVDSILYNKMKFRTNQLGFVPLYKGFDSIQIRIWSSVAGIGDRVVVLENAKTEWRVEISEIQYSPNHSLKKTDKPEYWEWYLPSREITNKISGNQVNELISKLFALNIMHLPDENEISGYEVTDASHDDVIFVEIATKNLYRAYRYTNPEIGFSKHLEVRSIVEILKLIDEEFKLKRLWDYDAISSVGN
ncbi:hypothetical protein CAP36_01655 [Chitinophagaceae bacterium IBVUCB2]|nr:hypothetical protein CAP36_01655 [Chitinophagaceae bacterium IBVUCB2]